MHRAVNSIKTADQRQAEIFQATRSHQRLCPTKCFYYINNTVDNFLKTVAQIQWEIISKKAIQCGFVFEEEEEEEEKRNIMYLLKKKKENDDSTVLAKFLLNSTQFLILIIHSSDLCAAHVAASVGACAEPRSVCESELFTVICSTKS